MGYVATEHAAPDTEIGLAVRGRVLPGRIERLPFVPAGYVKS